MAFSKDACHPRRSFKREPHQDPALYTIGKRDCTQLRMRFPVILIFTLVTLFGMLLGEEVSSKPEQKETNSTHINRTRSVYPSEDPTEDLPLQTRSWNRGDRGFSADGTLYGNYGTGYRSYSTEYDGYRGYGPYPGSDGSDRPRYNTYYGYPYYPSNRRAYSEEKSAGSGRSYVGYDDDDYYNRRRYYNTYLGSRDGYNGGKDRASGYDDYRRSYLGYPTYGRRYGSYYGDDYNRPLPPPPPPPAKTTYNYGRAYLAGSGTNNGDYNGSGYWRLSPRYDDSYEYYYRPKGTYRSYVGYDRGSSGKSW